MNTNPRAYELKGQLVAIKDVCLSFQGKPVLSNISATVLDIVRPNCITGQIIGILGPSGIGKTQLSKILTGLRKPTSGSVLIGPNEIPVPPGIVGYVPQAYPLFSHRTVLGCLTVAACQGGLRGKDARDKVLSYLEMFDLVDKQAFYPAQLSGGQRQRIAIVEQLLCSEHYLVMDEPFTGLDPVMKDKVCALVKKVSGLAEENTIFIVAHDIDAVLSVADHVWVLGRKRDEKGQSLGATILYNYDLIERGIAWSEQPQDVPAFVEVKRDIRAKFHTL